MERGERTDPPRPLDCDALDAAIELLTRYRNRLQRQDQNPVPVFKLRTTLAELDRWFRRRRLLRLRVHELNQALTLLSEYLAQDPVT